MKHFPLLTFKSVVSSLLLGALLVGVPAGAASQSMAIALLHWQTLPLLHSASQGYLGVEVADVDANAAQNLRLKELRGVLITRIDHDAPACAIGLHVNDVILQLNGQSITGMAQLRKMLRDLPAGHTVRLIVLRDGTSLIFEPELADRRVIAKHLRNQLLHQASHGSGPALGFLSTPTVNPPPHCVFHWWTKGSNLNVGASVEPLSPQMANYLDVSGGLMVKSVVHKSEADSSGFRPHDILLKVGNEAIATLADWERALHANRDKPVSVLLLRDHKQLTLILQVDSKHRRNAPPQPAAPAAVRMATDAR